MTEQCSGSGAETRRSYTRGRGYHPLVSVQCPDCGKWFEGARVVNYAIGGAPSVWEVPVHLPKGTRRSRTATTVQPSTDFLAVLFGDSPLPALAG